jgi:hypothetical protein
LGFVGSSKLIKNQSWLVFYVVEEKCRIKPFFKTTWLTGVRPLPMGFGENSLFGSQHRAEPERNMHVSILNVNNTKEGTQVLTESIDNILGITSL